MKIEYLRKMKKKHSNENDDSTFEEKIPKSLETVLPTAKILTKKSEF